MNNAPRPVSADVEYLPDMPKNRDVSIGCVGAGFIMADCHLVAYRQAGFNPVAIASRTRQRTAEVAAKRGIETVYSTYAELLADERIEVVDIAVPPDIQIDVVREALKHHGHIRGILAQKPLGVDYAQAKQIVEMCAEAGITLAVNQNMRYDHSVRGCKYVLDQGWLGEPVLATIDMRAIPHWMAWQQRLGWVTLRIMSIHHLDTFRYWLGDPVRVFASVRPDPRTAKAFAHEDGICLYILEYENGMRAAGWDDVWTGPAAEGAAGDIGIRWRVEGTEGLARGTIGWPDYPRRTPSTLDFTSTQQPQADHESESSSTGTGHWYQPRWDEVWFPDSFSGPMAQLLCALEEDCEPDVNGAENLKTMALVDACYLSAAEHRAVELAEILDATT